MRPFVLDYHSLKKKIKETKKLWPEGVKSGTCVEPLNKFEEYGNYFFQLESSWELQESIAINWPGLDKKFEKGKGQAWISP